MFMPDFIKQSQAVNELSYSQTFYIFSQCHTLDHYFVSSVNLLDGIPDVLAGRVVDTVQSIVHTVHTV